MGNNRTRTDNAIVGLSEDNARLRKEVAELRAAQLIPRGDQRDVLIYAFRYTLGRCTYAPHMIVAILREKWATLADYDQALFRREISAALVNDAAGHECARQAWASILELYDKEVKA